MMMIMIMILIKHSVGLYCYLFLHGRERECLLMGRLRACPRHSPLLKSHAIYNFSLHSITFFYSQLTSLYCFSNRVLRMKSTAFFVYSVLYEAVGDDAKPSPSSRDQILRSVFFSDGLRRSFNSDYGCSLHLQNQNDKTSPE